MELSSNRTPRRLEHIYKLFFLCDLEGGSEQTGIETSAAQFFAVDALPTLSVGRTLAADVELLRDHSRDPSLGVYFD